MKVPTARILLALIMLSFAYTVQAQTVVRGPYLQQQDDDSIIVRWRTDTATESVVRFGLSSSSLNLSESVAGTTTEHTVLLEGLSPLTTYYYSVGNVSGSLAGDASYFFHTSPLPGSASPTRFWVLGDSGTNTPAQTSHVGKAIAVRDAFTTFSASQPADFMIMLGDNAYNDGTDVQYQDAVFNTYPVQLRQLPLWPTLGNHDGYTADSATESGPYYDIFDLPRNAEVGGVESFTEAYHSWDYGNIHFINLDSYETDRSTSGNMLQWLESDLAMNDKLWVIAMFHHPPYTKGSHDSDSEGELVDMRQNALPILEAWGVDLVMSGHSHSYERSFLLDGHYGISDSLDLLTEVLDGGDGSETGDGAYEKPPYVRPENEGAVYTVAGSSGKVSGLQADAPHEAMHITLQELGSLVVDITGNRLDAVFLDDMATIRDEFTIIKTPDTSPPLIANVRAEDAIHVVVDFTERLDAETALKPVNYDIPGLLISAVELVEGDQSVRLTTSVMSAMVNYTLTVNDVEDRSGNPILPDSQFVFSFIEQWTVSFQDGLAPTPAYAGTIDTFIREASATSNYGASATLETDGDEPSGSGTDMYSMIAWDVSHIPPTASVDDVKIHFNVLDGGGTYQCFGLLKPWVEMEATWNQASSGSAWSTAGAKAGADRDATSLCSISSGAGPLTVTLNGAGIALVQGWVDGTNPNYGVIIADPTSSNGVDFDSSDSAAAMNRPRLEVSYSFGAALPNQAPSALFGFSCTSLWCSFIDASTDVDGTVVEWSWDFGDGSHSVVKDPLHEYASAGTYSASLSVTDNDGTADVYNLAVNVTPLGVSAAIDVPIGQSSDDVEQALSDGYMYMDSSDLELGDDLSNNGAQTIGLRFNNLAIPPSATITDAYIRFTGDENRSDATSVQFFAEDTDDAPAFSTSAYDLTDRTTTSASVNWDNIPAWAVNGQYDSPDLTAVVQEVIDRPGWFATNSMVFVIPGSGRRAAEAYDGEPLSSPVLHVEFEGGSCSASRDIVADRWESFALPCDPGVNNQVQQVLSALASGGTYGVTWIVYRFDESSAGYVALAADDVLLPGYGYWIYTMNAATINMVGDFNTLPDRALTTEASNGRQNFVGNYRNEVVSWPDVLVVNGSTESNIAVADPLNDSPPPVAYECDMRPAGDDCLVSRHAYWWSGSNYDTFSALVPGMEGEIPVADAIWVRAFKPGSTLRFPTGVTSSSAQSTTSDQKTQVKATAGDVGSVIAISSDQSRVSKKSNGKPWVLRLIVSSNGKQDRGNVIGQLQSGEDGLDINDLEERQPFGDKFLSLTFDNPSFPEAAWGYTSDFRELARKPEGEWHVRVRASADVEEVRLSWEGDKKLLKDAWIKDEQTGRRYKMKHGKSYTFDNASGDNRFSITVGKRYKEKRGKSHTSDDASGDNRPSITVDQRR